MIDERLHFIRRLGKGGAVDRCTQLTDVVEMTGCLMGEIAEVITEG